MLDPTYVAACFRCPCTPARLLLLLLLLLLFLLFLAASPTAAAPPAARLGTAPLPRSPAAAGRSDTQKQRLE